MPVATNVRNPVALGDMLDKASKEVGAAIEKHNVARAAAIEKVAEGKKMALVGVEESATALARMAYGSADTDLSVYRRGEAPAPVSVAPPTGSELSRMTPDQKKEHAWRFLSTTQGRRTAMETMRTIIFETLIKAGVPVTLREFDPKTKTPPLAFHEWKVNMSGAGSTQPAFNIIDTAAKAIAHNLNKRIGREATVPDPLFLEVIPVNTVDIRSVGWAARLVP